MQHDDLVVYSFYVAETGAPEMPMLSTFKATRRAIEAIPGARVAEGTSMTVSPDDLDEFGRFFRRPTGWGELS